ncbi:MAG: hypothetical protein GKS06_13975 [Acidobacteria bacterium]|nr:hypothetical protein [Acidobacteriota bacterium]
MSLFGQIERLPLRIDRYRLEPRSLDVASGWQRLTTTVVFEGEGHEGRGEDVVYEAPDQLAHHNFGSGLELVGEFTLTAFSERLDAQIEGLPPCSEGHSTNYRRWAYESAALDLALRQSSVSLAASIGVQPAPLNYVVSTGLGSPANAAPLQRVRALYPQMRFKIDLGDDWTPALVEELAAFGGIDTVDYKGLYRGNFSGPEPDPEMYRLVAEAFPYALLEDPAPEIIECIEPHWDRVSWDACLHSVADIEALPFPPKTINIKPSRFGTWKELLAVYEYCREHEIAMYGGGQFELGCGRDHIQLLASLFHPAGANDVAPSGFNSAELAGDLPASPIDLATAPTGFRLL